jgi:nucleoside-diphosphate-sugar epimerase
MAGLEEWSSSRARFGVSGRQNSAYGPAAALLNFVIMSSYLVTGGAGFIGSHLAEALLQRGHRVRLVDSLVTGNRRNLVPLSGAEFIEGDLADPEVANASVAGMEYVLHQAAIPSVPRSIVDPRTSHRANIDATLNVFLAARDHGVKRVVFAGSSSVYGDAASLPVREDMPTRPLSPYALQKLTGEHYGRLFHGLYGLETVTPRYFNVFGPRQDPSSPYSGVISLFISALVERRAPTICGDGEQSRDFTYVGNVVDGVLRACHEPRAAGTVINVATGGRTSLNRLVAILGELTGSAVEATHEAARAGDVRHSQADISRARDLLGYEPLIPLAEGLQRTLEWYRAERVVATLTGS